MKAGDGLEATEFLTKIGQTNGVVKNSVGAIIICVRPSNNTNDRKVLTVSSSNGIENTKPTHCESDNTSPNPTSPGIAIGSIPSIELIAAANVREPWLSNEMVKKGKVKITGHREHILNTNLHEAAGQVAA